MRIAGGAGAGACAAAVFAVAAAAAGAGSASGSEYQDSRRAPDWSAPWRWVHVDNVAASKAGIFEGARRAWLAAITRGGGRLDDGRTLFWSADRGDIRTYLTFSPFSRFADLDARRTTARATDEAAGRAAVAAYDDGDAALVAPHFSQIWRRDETFDYAPPGGAPLTEADADAARAEWREPDPQGERAAAEAWAALRAALARENYPVACRGFWSAYGGGETVLLWLSKDAASLAAAPSLEAAAARALGAEKASELLHTLDRSLPIKRTDAALRRPDLSNP